MPEFTSPALVTIADEATLTDRILDFGASQPEQVLLRHKAAGTYVDLTAAEFLEQVLSVAGGLVAHGITPGDRVAVMSRTRYEWTVLDYAIWAAGAVTVPIYETSSADQVAWILTDSAARLVVVETTALAALVAQVRDEAPALRDVLVLDAPAGQPGALARLRADGAEVTPAALAEARAEVRADSPATLIYTSGTTGRPKGCELSHRALLFDALASAAMAPEVFTPDASTLLFLPLAHVFARLVQNLGIQNRILIAYSPDTKTLLADLVQARPTYMLAVPRVFEKVHAGARRKAHSEGKGKIFDAAEQAAVRYSQALDTAAGPALGLRLRHALFDRLVYGKLRSALGGRVQFAVSGGAPLGERLGHFFRGVGVTILEGYGLTETSAAVTVNRPESVRIGTVGQPLPGVTIRIAPDGEVLVRGELLFTRYHANETATKEALDVDGYFHTGDVGSLDADGFLRITGRKKEILVTAAGKNIAPAPLEHGLQSHPLVSQAMVIGDRRPFVAVLLTLDEEALPQWLGAHSRPVDTPPAALVHDRELLADLQTAVDRVNASVSHAEAIKKFVVLPVDFTVETGELTPSLKVRRAVVMDKFASAVDQIYGPSEA